MKTRNPEPGTRNARERGVTSLVEIIVIVVILSVLVSATVYSFRGARARAMIRMSCSVLLNVRNAMHSYWADNDEYPSGVASFSGLYTKLSANGLDTDPTDSFRANSFSYNMLSDTYDSGGDGYVLSAKAKGPRPVALTVEVYPGGLTTVVTANDGMDFSDLCR